jgi:purine-binding chemotaxis protein CheW
MRTTPLRRLGHEQPAAATTQYLLFAVHGVTYAVSLLSVREVMDLVRLAPVAGAPDALLGTQVLRGHRIPVVDLGAVLEHRRLRLTRTSCTLVVQRAVVQGDSPAEETLIGLAVDGVRGVIGLAASDLAAPPRLGETLAMDIVSAMASTAQGLAPVLDPARVLVSTDARQAVAAWLAAETGAAQPVGSA